MFKVGVTGGIGSGKTTVCTIFKILGVPVYNADFEAQKLMVTQPKLIAAIKTKFGKDAYLHTNQLNRKHISDIVFNDNKKLQTLNNLVHPAVFNDFVNWCTQQKSLYVLKEAALLFETNFYKHNNYNILVSAPLNLRINNVVERDKVSREKVLSIISKQMPEENKQLLADFNIQNNEKAFLINQVLSLHLNILKMVK